MKCIGAATPPCDRCRKAGRECLTEARIPVQKASSYTHVILHQPSHSYDQIPPHHDVETVQIQRYPILFAPAPPPNDSNSVLESDLGSSSLASPQIEGPTRLPTIYSASPVDAVAASPQGRPLLHDNQSIDGSVKKRRRLDDISQSHDVFGSPKSSVNPMQEHTILQRQDIQDMINL
jgi:hypothetical protein